jgi:hypothetical protein
MTTADQYGFGVSEGEYTLDNPDDIEQHQTDPWPAAPLRVVNMTETAAPQYGSCMTWTVPQVGVGQPVQILQRRVKRSKGKLYINSLPTVLTVITSPVVPASGTPLYNTNPFPVVINVIGGTVTVIAVNGVTTGLTSGPVYVPAGGIITITYSVAPTLTWQSIGSGSLMINSKLDPLQGANPQGATYSVAGSQFLDWENQQPLYAIGIGGNVTVTAVDEAYGER